MTRESKRIAKNEKIADCVERLKNNDPNFTKLDLSSDHLNDKDALDIIDALKFNHTLMEIDLSGNKITEAAAIYIADTLKTNQTLIKISLDDTYPFIEEFLKRNREQEINPQETNQKRRPSFVQAAELARHAFGVAQLFFVRRESIEETEDKSQEIIRELEKSEDARTSSSTQSPSPDSSDPLLEQSRKSITLPSPSPVRTRKDAAKALLSKTSDCCSTM